MINKRLNNMGLSEKEINMRTWMVQEYLRSQGKLVTPFTLFRLNEIYESIDYNTKCKLYKEIERKVDINE